jgi:Na+-transporting NADH:ubiquinone oxidoreductase subunit F
MLEAYLISVGTMCLITTVLALIMVLADATIGNYGEVTIRINDQKELKVEGGGNLLGTLKTGEVFIPSACGGRGSCGLCKVTVQEGAGPLLPTETPWLSQAEQDAHIRLACQVRVKRDMRIVIPDELFNVRQFRARVAAIRDLTHDIKGIRLKLLEPDRMDFVAGQFVQIEVPPYELTEEAVYRAYSIASDPAAKSEIELEIRYVPNGICTTYVHRHLKEGDTVTLNGPYGDFYLRDTDAEVICIAGGSGMAPIKSILHHMVNTGSRRRTRYFFGAKSKRDLFLVDEMKTLEQTLPAFEFIPALSEPDAADNWQGETGLITEVVGRHVDSAGASEAYLCGSPLMIDACVEVLKSKGMPEEHIYYDKFA